MNSPVFAARRQVHFLRRGQARFSVAALFAAATLTSVGHGQDAAPERRPAERDGLTSDNQGRPSPFSIFDSNRDGVVSAEEINAASAVLRRFDRNGDGRLSGDELRPGPRRRKGEGASGAGSDDRLPPPPAPDAP
jgi:hypothetical protein